MGLRSAGEGTWLSEWENGARRVISLFLLRGDCAVLCWGWNYDFLPEVHSGRIKYFRTEKSVSLQLRQLPREFIDGTDWSEYRVHLHARQPEELKENVLAVWRLTEPQITGWYSKTDTPEKMLSELERQKEHGGYYRVFYPEQAYVQAFLTARYKDVQMAEKLLQGTKVYREASAENMEKLMRKLRSCGER